MGRYTLLAEGARGSLSKQAIARFNLAVLGWVVGSFARLATDDRRAHGAGGTGGVRTGP